MADLTHVFPTASELSPGWKLDACWWSASRGTEGTGLRRVYLNGGGTDHELRFHVFPAGNEWRSNRSFWPECDRCHGTRRVERPAHDPSPFHALGKMSALAIPDLEEYDAPDENGLRRCDALNCIDGRVEPIYGATNSRIRVPGFPTDLLRKTGARGMSEPTKAEVLRVMPWCDTMIETINRRLYLHGHYP